MTEQRHITVSPEVHERLRKLKHKHEFETFQELLVYLISLDMENVHDNSKNEGKK